MSARRSLILVAVAVLLTSATTAAAVHYGSALQRTEQRRQVEPRTPASAAVHTAAIDVTQPNPVAPQVLSGPDVGFRIEGVDPRTGNPMGIWVVRVNGEWVEAMSKPVLRRGEE